MASFRARVAVLVASAVAVAVALASVAAYLVTRAQLRDSIDDALRQRADAVLLGPADPFRFRLEAPLLGGAGGYAQVVSPEGRTFRPPGARTPLPTDGAAEVAAGRREPFVEDATVAGTHVRILTTRLSPSLAVQIARPLDEVDRTLHRLALLLAAVSLGGVALAAGAGVLVTRAALAPVRRLTETAEHVTATRDLSRRIEAAGGDELGRLAASFNAMLEALDESMRSQTRLVADASHELRTPLTSLRTNVEVLERGEGLDDHARRRILGDVRAQLEELTELVADLLELARGRETNGEREAIRLDGLVADAVERARRRAPEVRFATHLQPSSVSGVRRRLDRAVTNLLDNAAKWSPPGGVVEVDVRGAEISVRDHGPGIAAADLPHVFDRFYRAPSARAVAGSGLGLAIVRQVAEEHGGTVSAETAPGGGARLRLSLLATS
jgi:two-component system sensor histidine kinase MprB